MQQELPAVRIARPADEEAVMESCRRLHRENGLFSFNDDKVRSCLHRCFNAEGTIVGVIGEPGNLQASTCMAISDYYYSNDWHLAELWNYVEKEHRRSRNAEALIEFGKECSEKMGVPFLTGIITNKQMAGKVRLYRRLLGYPAGAFFIHNASWKSEPMEDHGTLRARLKDYAKMCNEFAESKVNNKVLRQQFLVARAELGPLLREAAEAISAEDNLWGSAKPNGSAHGSAG
jgi:hypothetical protein